MNKSDYKLLPHGDISSLSINGIDLINNFYIYSFAQTEPTRWTLGNENFLLSKISRFKIKNDTTSFIKYLKLNDKEIKIYHKITKIKNGVVLFMSAPKIDFVRFGWAIPVNSPNFINPVRYSLINYQRFWERKWIDQDYVELPICLTDKNIFIFTDLDYNSQFFRYSQNNIEYLRISRLSNKRINLSMFVLNENKLYHDILLETFPKHDSLISFWKVLFRKIKHEYSIDIVNKSALSTNEINNIFNVINIEIQKYPNTFFDRIGCKEFVILHKLQNKNNEMSGLATQCSIVINDTLSQSELSEVFHHEIFHFIQKNIEIKNNWQDIHDIFPFYQNIQNIGEQSSILFSKMMIDPLYISNLLDTRIIKNCRLIESIFFEISNANLLWNRQENHINIPAMERHSSEYKEHKKMKFCSGKILICGLESSGIIDLKNILQNTNIVLDDQEEDFIKSKNSFIKIIYNISELNQLQKQCQFDIVLFVRHPNSHIKLCNNIQEAQIRIDEWININTEIFNNKNHIIIKYEDLLFSQIGVLKKISNFTGFSVVDKPNISKYNPDKEDLSISVYIDRLIKQYENNSLIRSTGYN